MFCACPAIAVGAATRAAARAARSFSRPRIELLACRGYVSRLRACAGRRPARGAPARARSAGTRCAAAAPRRSCARGCPPPRARPSRVASVAGGIAPSDCENSPKRTAPSCDAQMIDTVQRRSRRSAARRTSSGIGCAATAAHAPKPPARVRARAPRRASSRGGRSSRPSRPPGRRRGRRGSARG